VNPPDLNLPEQAIRCICLGKDCPQKLCADQYTLREQGIQVKLKPKSKNSKQTVKAIVVDGCLLGNKTKKCDGLFIFSQAQKTYIALIELKGSNIEDAFEQLSCTRDSQEYRNIHKSIRESFKHTLVERWFIITSRTIGARERCQYEKEYDKIRLKVITCDRRSQKSSKRSQKVIQSHKKQ